MEYWVHLVTSGFLYAIGVGIIGFFVKNMKKDTQDIMKWQARYCCQRFGVLEESDIAQWKAIDKHGHKGLDGEDSKVVR